jgi:hypothetical protein
LRLEAGDERRERPSGVATAIFSTALFMNASADGRTRSGRLRSNVREAALLFFQQPL